MDWARLRLTEGRRFDAPGVPPLAAEHAVVQQVAMRIRDLGKGGARPGDFADLALAASRAGNVDAAAMVLEYEADAARTVRMLLEWNRGELALARAVANMERDLVYMVLIYLEKRLRLSDLLETVRACPEAWPYLERYARDNDRGLLRRIYHQENRDVESGNLLLEDAAKASVCSIQLAIISLSVANEK
ncbi:Vps16, C-terminal region-domain-containing protein [Blastocladiella britannica]|nr:Vps16, C-terminal region-domain-containing protein [Blastocladiella britannica]